MDDEVGVQIADAGGAARHPLAAGGLDQAAGEVALGVAEDRPRVGAGGGLRRLAVGEQAPLLGLDRLGGGGAEGEGGGERHHAGPAQAGAAVAEAQLGARQHRAPAPAQHLDRLDEGADGAAVADAGVAVDRAAEGARDADREFEAAQPPPGGGARERGQHHRRAGRDRGALEAQSGGGAAQRDHERVDALVGGEQVGAAAQHAHAQARGARPGEQPLQLTDRAGDGEVARGAADAQVGVARERRVAVQLDALGRGGDGIAGHGPPRRGGRRRGHGTRRGGGSAAVDPASRRSLRSRRARPGAAARER